MTAPQNCSSVTDDMVERAWAAIVGADVAPICFQAGIIRADLRTALEAILGIAQIPGYPNDNFDNPLEEIGHYKDALSTAQFYIAGLEKMVRDNAQAGINPTPPAFDLAVMDERDQLRAMVERCAKIAEPWAGFWLDENSTDADRAVVAVRTEIAAKIRALSLSSTDSGSAATKHSGTFLGYRDEHGNEMHCAHAFCPHQAKCRKGCINPVAVTSTDRS